MAFHNGSFDLFDEDSAASAGIEIIAEAGFANVLNAEHLAADPGSVRSFVFGPAFPRRPIFTLGETVTTLFDIDGSLNWFFSYFSMLTPTNDTFLANDHLRAFSLFDTLGALIGDRVINISRSQMWDAGTEITNPLDGAADLVGVYINQGTAENGVIHATKDLSAFAGLQSTFGQISPYILTNPDAFVGVSISIRQRPAAIPLLASGLLLLGALAGLGCLHR